MAREIPTTFPDGVAFRHAWRPYQSRVIAALDAHLDDRHFHLVAAPGSGKTVVGLEVLRRLGKPALVFAPTVAIRDQWIRRFVDSFWEGAQPPDWISTDLSQPGLLTIATYQSLTAFEKSGEVSALVKTLDAAGVRTLVFDEAHHLRNQWWKTLDQIKAGLTSPVVIALTATPPYDVTQIEWNRYASICGVVDEEISTPELVKAGNLCPHQDFIYVCEPTDAEKAELETFERGTAALLADLALDEAFIQAIREHPVLARPAERTDDLLSGADYYLSLAVFLQHASGVVPETLLEALGLTGVTLPAFGRGWAEVLLAGVLFSDRDSFRPHEDVVGRLHRDLDARGAIERRTVSLRSCASNARLLRSSPSKLRGVADIVELESRALDWRLRMLVLTDFIRDEDFPDPAGTERAFTKVGVVPIFEYLRRLQLPNVRLGVVTGRRAVFPAAAAAALDAAARALRIDLADFPAHPLGHDPSYLGVEFSSGDGARFLELATRLFTQGDINVLIGTAALLGEGWDAPAVNTLVMATVIGSYVSSNQIRGRAIRTDAQDPFKTANIWHLACIPTTPGTDPGVAAVDANVDPELDADDWAVLERRFGAFVGLRHDGAAIENGIERLGTGPRIRGSDPAKLNARMCAAAGRREQMAEGWRRALFHPAATRSRVMHEVFVPVPRLPSRPIARRWLHDGGWFARLREWWLERRMRRIAWLLLDSLRGLGMIQSPSPEIAVSTGKRDVLVRVGGVNCREESLFVGALREVFDPLQSPRYLLVTKDEEFAVPRPFGERKERAESFARAWRQKVGAARLLYVQTPEGKRRLLIAKERFLAARDPLRTSARLFWG